jgi:hypothetical protein
VAAAMRSNFREGKVLADFGLKSRRAESGFLFLKIHKFSAARLRTNSGKRAAFALYSSLGEFLCKLMYKISSTFFHETP